jgi:adenylyl-sulfate kinase
MTSPDKIEQLRPQLARIAPGAALLRVSRAQRPAHSHHAGGILWLTGLSGAGKTTLGAGLERTLVARGHDAVLLDGDQVRRTLSADLGFSAADRSENIRRAGGFAAMLAEAGVIAIAAFISPYRADRDRLRAAYGAGFCEVWLSAGLSACEQRDVKGLYAKARRGELPEFTGISAPYEPPLEPDLAIDTGTQTEEQAHAILLRFAVARFRLSGDTSQTPRNGAGLSGRRAGHDLPGRHRSA